MNRKRYWGLACLALGVWLLADARPVLGQGHTWIGEGLTRMVDGARWRIGGLRINAAFTLDNAGYDSDIYYGFLQNAKVPDETFTAGTPVQLIVPLGKTVVLDLSDSPQYLFYLDTKRERAWNNTFQGRIHIGLERLYVQAGGDAVNVRRRFSPELDINVREKRDSLNGLVFWQAAKRTSLAVLYSWTRFEYEDIEYAGASLADRLNRVEDLLDGIVYVQPGPRWRPFLDGQYGVFTFTGEGSVLRNAKNYGFFAGVEFIPITGEAESRRGFQGAFRLGYRRLEVTDPGVADGSGFSGEGDVTFDLTSKTSIHALFSRGFEFSIYSGAVYYVSTNYGGGLAQRLSRRTSLAYEISLGRMSYPEDTGGLSRLDRYSAHTVSLDIWMGRHLKTSLSGSLNRRTLGTETLPHNRYFVGISLIYGSPGGGLPLPLPGLVR
jgi:Putative beta-barrel porin 2